MGHDILLWSLGLVLLVTATVAAGLARTVGRLRARVAGLEADLSARDATVNGLVTRPSSVDMLATPAGGSAPAFGVPARLEGAVFVDRLRALLEQHAEALRRAQEGAEQKARQATEAAVRSFAATVVSLGTDLSKIVAEALREHHDDNMFATLNEIDHTVQQMVRHAQSYLFLCGGLPGRRWPATSLTDVVRGAMSRIHGYRRIQSGELDRAVVAQAVEPVVHALATLLDNAVRYSPPTSWVEVRFQLGHHGVTIVIDDAGTRMNDEQLDQARQILSGRKRVDVHRLGAYPKVGFPVLAVLSARYGFQVSLDGPNPYGGMRTALFLPDTLLTSVRTEDEEEAVPVQQPPEQTPGGLPRRRRRAPAATQPPAIPAASSSAVPGRPGIVAAWQAGTASGRASVAPDEPERS